MTELTTDHRSSPPQRARRPRTPPHIWKPAFLAALTETGNVTVSARAAGVDRSTVTKARQRSPKFAALWKQAMADAADILEAEARKRALEGWDEPVYYKGEVVGYVRKFSDTLMVQMLKAKKPDEYRENQRIEHVDVDTVPQIEIFFEHDPDLELAEGDDDDVIDVTEVEPDSDPRQLEP